MSASGIDPSVRSAREIFRQSGLTPFREVLSPALFQAVAPPLRHPGTVLVPEVVFWLMALVPLTRSVMADAIGALWSAVRAAHPYLPSTPLTGAAFCTARRNLPTRFFRRVFQTLVERYEQRWGAQYRWHGYRLVGIDGTRVTLPAEGRVRAAFPPPANQHGASRRPQALLVGLVGLWSGLCHDFIWTRTATGEPHCAMRLTRHLGPHDLLLADCNFTSYALFARLQQRGADLLMRVSSNRFIAGRRDAIVSGRDTESLMVIRRPRGADPTLPAQLDVRVIHYQISGFRPARLITSLCDPHRFSREELIALYHERWRHETIYGEWKHTLQINNLRSHTALGLYKEVLVQLTLNNAVRWVQSEAAGHERRPVDLSFPGTLRLLTHAIPVMTIAPLADLPRLWRELIDSVGAQVILVRPGRSYPRRDDEQPRNKGHGKYAQLARLPSTQEHING